jgi:hypothetical protein
MVKKQSLDPWDNDPFQILKTLTEKAIINEGLKCIYGNIKAETCTSLSPSSHPKENPSWNMHLAYCANMKVESGVWKFYN